MNFLEQITFFISWFLTSESLIMICFISINQIIDYDELNRKCGSLFTYKESDLRKKIYRLKKRLVFLMAFSRLLQAACKIFFFITDWL